MAIAHTCRAGYYAQCDNANPNGPRAGTAFFGGPQMSGPFHGLQAEKARVPFANIGLVKLPDTVSDDQAILLSDIFPTGYFGAGIAEIEDGDTVAVFGCGPVGQFAILSAKLYGASRVIAVDHIPDRLAMARTHLFHHRRLPAKCGAVSDRRGHEQEPDDQHGQLQSSPLYTELIQMVASGSVDPTQVLTQDEPLEYVMNAYEPFDKRHCGYWRRSPRQCRNGFG